MTIVLTALAIVEVVSFQGTSDILSMDAMIEPLKLPAREFLSVKLWVVLQEATIGLVKGLCRVTESAQMLGGQGTRLC